MGNLFDPNNPKTWPENFKAPTTAAFTNKGVPARDLAEDKVKKRFSGLTPETNDPYYESGKALFDMAVVQPVKSLGRTFSGKNASVYANPLNNASWKERGMALGEDVLNVAALYPGVRAGVRAGAANSYAMGEPIVHASNLVGLKEIQPFKGSLRYPKEEIAYAWNPDWKQNVGYPRDFFGEAMQSAINHSYKLPAPKDGGRVYVGRARQGDIVRDIPSVPTETPGGALGQMTFGHSHGGPVTLSRGPMQVRAEIPFDRNLYAQDPEGYTAAFRKQYEEALNRRSTLEKFLKRKIK